MSAADKIPMLPGETLRQYIKRKVEMDPITLRDRRSLAELRAKNDKAERDLFSEGSSGLECPPGEVT